jgi:hypothetical protein
MGFGTVEVQSRHSGRGRESEPGRRSYGVGGDKPIAVVGRQSRHAFRSLTHDKTDVVQ